MICPQHPGKKMHRRAKHALAAMQEMQGAHPSFWFSVFRCQSCKMYHVGRLSSPTCAKAMEFYAWMERRKGGP